MISFHEQINTAFGYLHGMWRYRWSGLMLSWMVALGGWVYVFSLPDTYQARTTVNIDTSSVMGPLLSGLAVDTSRSDEVNVMTRVLLSRENLLNVIRETDMDHNVNDAATRERMVQGLAHTIRVNNVGGRGGSSVYEISYESSSPELAFKVVFNLLNTLIENTLDSGRVDTVNAEKFLDEQISEYEVRLTEAEERLAGFKQKNAGYMPNERGGYYARLNRQKEMIEDTRSALRMSQSRYSNLRKQLSGQTPLLGSSAWSTSTANKLRSYQEQLKDMLTQFTDEHPDVKALRARIEDLQSGNDPDAVDGPVTSSDDDLALNPVYQDLKAQESRARVEVGILQVQLAEQRAKLEELQKSVNIIPQVEADLERLDRDYSVTKQRYLALVERRESARLAQKVEQNNSEIIFRVVDAPVVPLLPSGPQRLMLLMLAFAAALGVGFGWCILRFLLMPTFVDYKQVQKVLGLPVLGAISLQVTPRKRRQRMINATVFLFALGIMAGSFGFVLLFQQPVTHQVRSVLTALGV